MTRNIQSNFPHMFQRTSACPLKCLSRDDQPHLLTCPVFLAKLSTANEQAVRRVQYLDIYGVLEEQLEVTLVLEMMLELREEILEQEKEVASLPVGATAMQYTLDQFPIKCSRRWK